MNVPLRMLVATGLLVLTVATGMGTSYRGKPFTGPLYVVHKLAALSVTGYTVSFIIGLLRMRNVGYPMVLLLLVGGFSTIALFVSGALLRKGRLSQERASTVHSIASVLMIVTIGIFLLLMIWRTSWTPIGWDIFAPL